MLSDRISDMSDSLAGLSVGDAFGMQFNWHPEDIAKRRTDVAPWKWSDDTEMALSICAILSLHGKIDQDALAKSFLENFDSSRGYGPAMVYDYFYKLQKGMSWEKAAGSLFEGQGSFGNGAAMRVAPLGTYFFDDLPRVVEEATRSAEVTHSHSEGIAGAVAVAIAAAIARQQRDDQSVYGPRNFIEQIIPYVPAGEIRRQLEMVAQEFGPRTSAGKAARILGNGSGVTAQDTVAFCLWMAARYLDDFQKALWKTVGEFGDMDTNCAIVGGIVASRVGTAGIPEKWIQYREELPCWAC